MASKVVSDIADLVSSSLFQRFALLQQQPNLFNAIGRTHTETWHSAFLGWLLDPMGSHRLGDFPMKRFLAATSKADLCPENAPLAFLTPHEIAMLAVNNRFEDVRVQPSERNRKEFSCDAGNVDCYIQVGPTDMPKVEGAQGGAKILVEMKVNAPTSDGQCKKYADYLEELVLKDPKCRVAAVFVVRANRMASTSIETTGDHRWYCIDFQTLHNEVFEPCSVHPDVSPRMLPLIEHYLLNMRNARGNGRMAYTEEERKFAKEILKKHIDTFKALHELLKEDEDYPCRMNLSPCDEDTDDEVPEISVAGKRLEWSTVAELMENALNEVWTSGRSLPDLPYASGRKRNLLSMTPKHKDESEFVSPKKFRQPNGEEVWMETNMSRLTAVKLAERLMKAAGLPNVRVDW